MSGVDFGPLAGVPESATKVLVSLDAGGGRWLVLDADGHREASVAAGPPVSPSPGVEVVVLPAAWAEWVCDVCGRELDRSFPIPVEDGWALCRGCAIEWGFPAAWAAVGGGAEVCPCAPCVSAAAGLSTAQRRGLLLRAGRLV